mmetsp:Transcript_24717/g.58039  ORF Transcript_24717/g.58039 Transcript_24717/m.58039 type:complete len:251 (-) Transcript_24717:860-1612(-)
MAELEFTASLPPLSNNPFPLAMERAAICGIESGRDSKMIIKTPIGTVIRDNVIPSASSLLDFSTPRGSGNAAICRSPSANVSSFVSVSFSLFFSTRAVPSRSATSRSIKLAAISLSFLLIRASAMACKIFRRTSWGSACNFLASVLAATAFSRASSDISSIMSSIAPKSILACSSSLLPGVQNKVPFDPNLLTGPKIARTTFKSLPEATTQAVQVDPIATALSAASIFDCMPPRPCALLTPIETSDDLST